MIQEAGRINYSCQLENYVIELHFQCGLQYSLAVLDIIPEART